MEDGDNFSWHLPSKSQAFQNVHCTYCFHDRKICIGKKNHSVFHSNFPFLYAHNLRKCLREELVVLGHGLKRGFFFRKIEEKSLFAGLRKNRKASVFVCLQMYCITTCFSLINQVGVVGRERNNTWLLLKKIHLI